MLPFSKITSKDNPLIKFAVKLQNSGRFRREHGLFVLEGLRLCRDAAENGYKFDSLLVSESAMQKYSDTVEYLSENSDKCYILSESLFLKITDTKNPQGIICFCKIPAIDVSLNSCGKYVALENIADPSNLGAVSRTAEALGISGLIVSSNSCDPFSNKALRASMGALLRLPIIVVEDFVSYLKSSGLSLYSCVVDADAASVTDIAFKSGSVAIIGNEANGLSDAVKAVSTPITIKMTGRAESLNAAVAASIVMWEMQK